MAVSVTRRIGKGIGLQSGQSIGVGEASAGEVNCSLNTTFSNFTLRATCRTAGEGGAAWWWAEFIRNRLAEKRVPRFADLYAVAFLPWASAEAEHCVPRGLDALAELPQGFGAGDCGVDGVASVALAATASAEGNVGAQGNYLVAEVKAAAVGMGLVRIEGAAQAALLASISASAQHARRATFRYGDSFSPLVFARGITGFSGHVKNGAVVAQSHALAQVGRSGIAVALAPMAYCTARAKVGSSGQAMASTAMAFSRGTAVTGALGSAQTVEFTNPVATAQAFSGGSGRAKLSLIAPHVVATVDHDPDDEEALTIALLAA